MGNICGKSSKPDDDDDHFSSPGRTLGSAPPQSSNARAPLPNRATKPPPKVTGPGRTIGGASTGTVGVDDPKTAAALAAEQRARSSQTKPKGKLGEQLDAQKRQTRTDTLEQASKDNKAARDADAAHEARTWN